MRPCLLDARNEYTVQDLVAHQRIVQMPNWLRETHVVVAWRFLVCGASLLTPVGLITFFYTY